MFGKKRATKPQTSIEQLQQNLVKSRELNKQLYVMSEAFVAQTNMLAASRKEVERV